MPRSAHGTRHLKPYQALSKVYQFIRIGRIVTTVLIIDVFRRGISKGGCEKLIIGGGGLHAISGLFIKFSNFGKYDRGGGHSPREEGFLEAGGQFWGTQFSKIIR